MIKSNINKNINRKMIQNINANKQNKKKKT